MNFKKYLNKIAHKVAECLPNLRDKNLVSKIDKNSLLFYFGNVHSQVGQDGILSEIFKRLKIKNSTFVEFGGWDGIFLSNCRFLFEKGWGGSFIEGDSNKFKILKKNYSDNKEINCINEMVGFEKNNNLSVILNNKNIDLDKIDFVSIDVDGIDLDIFENMNFKPKVVLIEGGFSLSPFLKRKLETTDISNNIQQSLYVIFNEATKHNYVPVCFYQDTYLVRNDLVNDNFKTFDVVKLYKDAFNFLPVDHRENLLTFRNNNKKIKEIETNYFGNFKSNPLNYDGK